jgi:hypothetical protein
VDPLSLPAADPSVDVDAEGRDGLDESGVPRIND